MTADNVLVNWKVFKFQDVEAEEEVQVKIPEVVDAAYSMYIWPSAPVLAQYVWKQRKWLHGKRIIELGAGTSLPGILAASCGAMVTLTDHSHLPGCLDNCHKSCQANRLEDSVRIVGLTWGEFPPEILRLPQFEVILASDCFYDTKDFENIIATLSFFLGRSKNARCWVTYQERSSDRSIRYLLLKWNLECVHIPLWSFDAIGCNIASSDLPRNQHTIQLLEITSRKTAMETPTLSLEPP